MPSEARRAQRFNRCALPIVNPFPAYLKSNTRNNGDGSPFTPVGLSGLLESKQAG